MKAVGGRKGVARKRWELPTDDRRDRACAGRCGRGPRLDQKLSILGPSSTVLFFSKNEPFLVFKEVKYSPEFQVLRSKHQLFGSFS